MSDVGEPIDRAAILVDQIVARSITDLESWDYNFFVINDSLNEPSERCRPFKGENFHSLNPLAAILYDGTLTKNSALSGIEAITWSKQQGGLIEKVVEMFTARDASVQKNGAQSLKPYIFLVGSDNTSQAVISQLAKISALQRYELDKWILDLIREKVSLKIENENLHETLSDFQNVFWRIEDTYSLGYEVKPGDGLVSLNQEALTQLLPVSTRGLADIDIHFANTPTSSFTLEIQLIEVESGQVLRRWIRSRRQIKQGWHRLEIPVALMSGRLTGELRLMLRDGQAPPLSMANPSIIERVGAQLGDVRLNAPLALRLWQALPGTLSKAPRLEEDHLKWTALPRADFSNLSIVSDIDLNIERDFEVFAKNYPYFRIHPLLDQVLIACVPLSSSITIFSARVFVGVPDSRGQPIECGLAFLSGDVSSISLKAVESAPSFSGWLTIDGGQENMLITADNVELQGDGNLCFILRFADNTSSQDFSRTHWHNIELLCPSANTTYLDWDC